MRRPRWYALLPVVVATTLIAPHSRAETVRAIVFVAPEAPDLDASLRDAVSAQLSGLPVELAFEHFPPGTKSLRDAATAARTLARDRQAAGVFWLDVEAAAEWLVYLAEPAGNRVLMRRVPVEQGGGAAGAESVAVILRQSTEALLSGQTIGMQQVVVPEEQAPREVEPAPAVAKPKRARLPPPAKRRVGPEAGVMYYTDSFATNVGYQSGIRVSASWLWEPGLYAGLAYTFLREADVTSPEITLRLRRTPFDAVGGYALSLGRFRPAVELRTMVDWVSRRNVAAQPGFGGTNESTRSVVYLSPRLRLDVSVFRGLAVHGALGADFGLNSFSYVIRGDTRDVTVLEPRRVRPSAELGITVQL